jgi:phosphate transport system permease protein
MMILGLLAFIAVRGGSTFWPAPLELVELSDGSKSLGEVAGRETEVVAAEGREPRPARRLIRTANFELTGSHFEWFDEARIASTTRPEWATAVERLEGGRFHGIPKRLLHGEQVVAEGPAETWSAFEQEQPAARRRYRQAMRIDKDERGELQRQLRAARLAVVQAGLDHGPDSPARELATENERRIIAHVEAESVGLDEAAGKLRGENEGWRVEFETASGDTTSLPLDGIVRAWQPNRLSVSGKLGVYFSRWGEFLGDDPREANSAGGVFPAIWGTVAMTLIMALLVAPFGVLAAL